MKISDLKSQTGTFSLEFGGGHVNGRFRMFVHDDGFDRRLRELEKQKDNYSSLCELFFKRVIEWDLTDDTTSVIPLSTEAFKANGVPLEVLTTILKRCREEESPN